MSSVHDKQRHKFPSSNLLQQGYFVHYNYFQFPESGLFHRSIRKEVNRNTDWQNMIYGYEPNQNV